MPKRDVHTNTSGCASASIPGSASMVEQFATCRMSYESVTPSTNRAMIRCARSGFLFTVTRVYGPPRDIAISMVYESDESSSRELEGG